MLNGPLIFLILSIAAGFFGGRGIVAAETTSEWFIFFFLMIFALMSGLVSFGALL